MDFDRIAVVLDVWLKTINAPRHLIPIHQEAEKELLDHISRIVVEDESTSEYVPTEFDKALNPPSTPARRI